MSVSLEDFCMIQANIYELNETGWLPVTHVSVHQRVNEKSPVNL